MKKLILGSCLAIISVFNVYGQWYVKKYNVTDINYLTREQLETSLAESKWNLFASAGVAVFGGGIYLISKYGDNSVGEDDSWFEQLIGEKGKKKLGMIAGLGMLAGGAVGSIVFAGRKGHISSVIHSNYPSAGSINLAPTFISNFGSQSFYPGFVLTYNF
jgi:hypothetical protein